MLVAVKCRLLVVGCGWEVPAGRGVNTEEEESLLLETVIKQRLVKAVTN
jgi:predicted small metal-binding protein